MKIMLPFMAVMADVNNDTASSIQFTGSHSSNSRAHQINKTKIDATIFDRPDICSLNSKKSVDNPVKRNIVQNSMPLVSKKEFIEQWLSVHSDGIHNNEIVSDNCSLSSVISDSPRLKRVLRSPLRNFNEIKRFKCANDTDEPSNLIKCPIDIDSAMHSKENRMINKTTGRIETICRYMTSGNTKNSSSKHVSFERVPSNGSSSDFKFQLHRNVICSSPKKVLKQLLTPSSKKLIESAGHSFESCKITPYRSPEHPTVNEIESESSGITEVESLAPSSPLFDSIDDCIECESPKKSDIQSLPPSPRVMKVRIDSESSDATDLGLIDTDGDKRISQVIDDLEEKSSISIDNSECDTISTSCAEHPIISPINSSSDETFFSPHNSLDQTIIEQEVDVQPSQTISQDCLSLPTSDVKSGSIDQDISSGNSPSLQSSKLENLDVYPTVSAVVSKKRRKPKKGSLVGRLQALVIGQTSFLRIWRHQMAQKHSERTSKQSFILKITNCVLKYNRQQLVGSVISDTHNLLDKIVQKNDCPGQCNLNNSTMTKTRTITVLTVPEIVGMINVKENSALEIYPPWDVIDAEKMVLSILYFRIVSNNSSTIDDDKTTIKNNEIVEKFDCPCLTANQLVESCEAKFTNVKPNFMQYLFDD